MKYRRLVSLTDEEITFAMKDIFHCTEIYRILRYKKNNEIHVEAAIPFQDEIILETVILEEDKLQAPWIDSWEEENNSNKKRDFIPLFSYFCLIHSLPHYCFTVLLSKKKMDGITILFLQTEQI